jgi:opacity protein-like surface antigen
MMTKNALFSLLLLAFALVAKPNPAHAFYVGLLGLEDTSNISASGFNVGQKSGYGGGLVFGGHPLFPLESEIGVLYFNRAWSDTTSGANVETASVYQFPLTFHYFVLPHLAFGAGGYYSMASGAISQTGATPNSNLAYNTYGISDTDYGFTLDAQLRFHIHERGFLRLEYRYTQSLENSAVAASKKFTNSDTQFIVGFIFIFGGSHGEVINK